MTRRDAPFIEGEWYHCYNRSIDERISFKDARDYQRFLELLYLANDESPLRRNDIGAQKLEEVLDVSRGTKLVTIGAFCLMPGHFHLALKEVSEGGITTFMRKLGTAYTLYFNGRYNRVGNLFLKPFQSIHVVEHSLPRLMSYLHANPAVLYEPAWKTGHVVDHQFVGEHLTAYPYSSLRVHVGLPTALDAIVDTEAFPVVRTVSIEKMLDEARKYSSDIDIP